MSPPTIRSARHPRLRLLRELGRGPAARREAGLFLLESPRAIREALEAGATVDHVLVCARLERDEDGPGLLRAVAERSLPLSTAAEELLARFAPTEHGRGAVAFLPLPESSGHPGRVFRAEGPAVVTLGVQDPGNLGSIVRTAHAFRAAGVVADASCADPWGPKAARGSAGALVRVPVARGGDATSLIEAARRAGRRVVAAVPCGGDPPRSFSGSPPVALLLGSEGRGLRSENVGLADAQVSIPLAPGVDSLGVAAAAAILLYELRANT